mgnify:CR=1 FL=1
MNKKFPYVIAGAAFAVYILTIIIFSASLFTETKKNNIEDRFRTIARETKQNLNTNDIDSDAFESAFLRSLGNLSDIAFVQIKQDENVIFSYPADMLYGRDKKSSSVRSFSTELSTKDDIALRLNIDIYRLKPYSIYRKGLIAFIIILITSLICLLYFIYLSIYGKESAKAQAAKSSDMDRASTANDEDEVNFDLIDDDDESEAIDDTIVIQDEDEDVDEETSLDMETMEQLDNEEKQSQAVSDEIAGIVAQLPVEDSPAPAGEANPLAPEPTAAAEAQSEELPAIEEAKAEDLFEPASSPEEKKPEEDPFEEISPDDIADIADIAEEQDSSDAVVPDAEAAEPLAPMEPIAEKSVEPEEPEAAPAPTAPIMEEEKHFAPIQPEQREHLQQKTIPSANSDAPKGLYSERTGFGWESYMIPRLDNELVRAASSEQDLALFTIKIEGLNWLSDEGTEIAKLIATAINFPDLIFEYGDDGCMAIYPNTNVENAIAIAEDLHTNMITVLQDYSDLRPVRIGISARSLRMISGERLANESAQALEHTDESSPIVAFKVNPQKYRSFLAEQAKLQQETL